MERFKGLVKEERIEGALHLLCYYYEAPPVLVVKGGKNLEYGEYEPEEGKIILYDRAFKRPLRLMTVVLHEFAHHLLETKYPLHLLDERLGRMYKEDPKYTRTVREEFAEWFTMAAMGRLGHRGSGLKEISWIH